MFVLMAVEDQLERLMSIQISNIGLELLSKPKPTFCALWEIEDAKVASFIGISFNYLQYANCQQPENIFWGKK